MIMDYLAEWSYLAVFVLAAVPWIELIVVVPLGIVLGLNPIAVGLAGFMGNWITMLLVILLFDRWRRWRDRRKAPRGGQSPAESRSKRKGRAIRIWEKYGLPGLAVSGPILIGAHIAAAVAMALNSPRKSVTLWMSLSLAGWTALCVIFAYYGFDAFGLIQSSDST